MVIRLKSAVLAASALPLMTPLGALAHHSVNAFFDQSRIIELNGSIVEVFWRNPHVGFTLDVQTRDGEQQWTLISSSINSLERNDITRDLFSVGDHVRVAGWPQRGDRKGMFITNFLMANGEEALMTATKPQPRRWTQTPSAVPTLSQNAETPIDTSIFRVWVRGEAYRPRRPLRFTAAAEAARQRWDPLTDDPALRCIPPGMSNAILNPYPIEFIDEGDTIRLRLEEWQATRLIHMRNAPPAETMEASPLGYSVGHWEGRTLVIETNRVNWPYLDGDGTPQSENVRMIERFTVSEDGRRLDFELTVDEPLSLLEPAVWEAYWVWNPRVEIKPYECDFELAN